MATPLLLAIDNGTQSLRALVFDPQGNLLTCAKVPLVPYFARQPGWAEQEADYYWQALVQACHQMWKEGIPPRDVAAAALTTQRGTAVYVDDQGRPLRPAIIWLDQRRAENLPPMGGLWGLLFKVLGQSETLEYFRAQADSNWVRQNEPAIWHATHKYLLLSGYLTYRLVGRFVDSVGGQVGYLPFDFKRLTWARPSDWKWRAVPVERRMLPDLVPPGQPLGTISPAAAEETGLPAGLPLIAAGADKACEVLGLGCLTRDLGCLSFGTTATVNTISPRYFETIPWLPPYPAAVPSAYCTEVQVQRGFWMVSWFKQEFGLKETLQGEELGVEAEQLFDDLLRQTPPGCQGLMLQPYWSPGLRLPGLEAKGGIVGFGDVHTRAHFYRAIIEGLGYALREGKDRIEQRGGVRITRLRISGGGSQSATVAQLTADLFGLPVERPHVFETSGLGAAIDAAVGIGLHRDFPTAVAAMTRLRDRFQPEPQAQRTYDALYRRVYAKMYKRLRPLYEELRRITGYPP